MAGRTRKPLIRTVVFWDTTALVPLCVGQKTTTRAIALYKTYEVAVWWATQVEIASALARLVRTRELASSESTKARNLAQRLVNSWFVVQPSDALRTKAIELVERYDLRAADSFQLAAALVWSEDAPRGRVFLTVDPRLREAAQLSGFDAIQI